jgi:proteic killer suppression protein
VIQSFADASTRDIFHGVDSKAARRIPKTIWPVVQRKLDVINAASSTQDLARVPGNRFEPEGQAAWALQHSGESAVPRHLSV